MIRATCGSPTLQMCLKGGVAASHCCLPSPLPAPMLSATSCHPCLPLCLTCLPVSNWLIGESISTWVRQRHFKGFTKPCLTFVCLMSLVYYRVSLVLLEGDACNVHWVFFGAPFTQVVPHSNESVGPAIVEAGVPAFL